MPKTLKGMDAQVKEPARAGEKVDVVPVAAPSGAASNWTQLGKVERGQRSLRLETIVKIAAGLEIEPGKLVNGLPAPT